jgi:hypothetical protein
VLLWCLISGCTHLQLQTSTVKQAESITELFYRQVLNNLAMFHCQPDALPHFSVTGTGGTSVNDHGEATAEFEWDPFSIARQQLGLGGSREIEEQWTLAPVVNPEKLRAIRCAFQLISHGTSSDPECDKLLVSFLGEGYGEWLPRGWYGCGRRRDVPRDACYTGHFGDQYVWVCSGHVESLTRLTIVLLNIATLDANEPPKKTVYTYNYDGDKLKSMEVTNQPETSGQSASAPADIKVRRDFYNPLQSQIQMKGR